MKRLLLLFGLLATVTVRSEERPWFQRALVGIETGPTGAQFGSDQDDVGYVARFSGRECVRRAAEANCDYIVIWARDGVYAYYDSKLQPKAPGLGERDVLRETIEEAKKHDMPVIAYCVLQYPTYTLHEHPDWRMRDKGGNPIERVCFNSPYVNYVKDLLREMMAYGLDGFHLDMVDQGFGPPYGCWCDYCAEKFERKFGQEQPKTISWDEDWDRMLEFRYNTSANFERELERFVKESWPGTTVDFNYHGNPPFSFEVGQRPVQHGVTGDFITGEAGLWAFSPLGVGLNAAFFRAVAPDRVVQVVIQRGVRHYHDQTTRPLNDIRWETMTALAHGAFVTMVDKTAYDGWLDPLFYERLGVVFGEAQSKRDHFGHEHHADVAIYYSHRNRDWMGREDASTSWQGFLGAHKAMVYDHLPWSVVLDEHAGLGRLEKFPVVILPNICILGPNEVETLTEYVTGGGNLVITGATGLYDRYGKRRVASVLEPLIGGRVVRELDSRDNHVRFSGEDVQSGIVPAEIPANWPFLVYGRGVVYEPTTAKTHGELMRPHRTVLQKAGKEGVVFPMSAGEAVGPAILANRVGKGIVLTLACSPGEAAASDFHIAEARKLLPGAVRRLLPDPLVSIDAPTFVEAVVTREDETLRVHLISRVSPSTATPPKNRPYAVPSLVEDVPLYRVRIRCRQPIADAVALDESTLLARGGEQNLSATIESIHETIVVKLQDAARSDR